MHQVCGACFGLSFGAGFVFYFFAAGVLLIVGLVTGFCLSCALLVDGAALCTSWLVGRCFAGGSVCAGCV